MTENYRKVFCVFYGKHLSDDDLELAAIFSTEKVAKDYIALFPSNIWVIQEWAVR